MKVLVAGGTGYIRAHMLKLLSRHGHEILPLSGTTEGRQPKYKLIEIMRHA